MIPENKTNLVIKALQASFGSDQIEDIRQLTTGLSTALVYRIVVQRRPYLLRIITRTDAMADPTLGYGCMKAGAEAGIGPQVWYASVEDRVAITDFVDAKPFPLDEARIKLPRLFKQLHALPPFPFRINYWDKIDEFIQKFREAKILPEETTDDLFRLYAKIRSVYPSNQEDMVACHNDLKPENILFDGERVWLVDWEAAFLNDRYLDLAIAANFVVREEGHEKEYLQEYFGGEITEYQRARFFLAQQMLHTSYLVAFMLFAKRPDGGVDPHMPRPGFREFHDRIWSGDISLANMDNRVLYSLVHMDQLRHNLHTSRFEKSLQIVSHHK